MGEGSERRKEADVQGDGSELDIFNRVYQSINYFNAERASDFRYLANLDYTY